MATNRFGVGAAFALLAVSSGAVADQVILDDLIVQFSQCIGNDCSNGESFGFDTLRLKENNTRIRFLDTSVTASFPTNDWQLTANDSSNGGANRFSIDDLDSGRTPFTVEAGAPNHALFVDSDGLLGIGTSIPVVGVHQVRGNTPSVRLEQNGTSGFQPQTWDIGGNESNFFVRDTTNGSVLPLRLLPGAAASSLVIAAGGDIGLGTSTPQGFLHIQRAASTGADPFTGAAIRVELTPAAVATNLGVVVTNNGPVANVFADTDGGQIWTTSYGAMLEVAEAGGAASAFSLTADGNLTIPGTLSEGSSRSSKHGITRVDPERVLTQVSNLQIAEWRYKNDAQQAKHIGPMAEDFHAAFGVGSDNKHITALDTAGVALASIQALNGKLETQNRELSQENTALAARVERLERLVQQLVKE